MYIVPTPPNVLDKKNRASGWRHVPLDKKKLPEWQGILAQLKDKGIEYVLSSDLDSDAANIVGSELHVPVRPDRSLRRFHIGRHHAAMADHLADILRDLEEKWKKNPDIPIRGGDSLTSFNRRFSRRLNQIFGFTETIAFVSDPLTIAFIREGMTAHGLVPNGSPIRRDRIYKVGKG